MYRTRLIKGLVIALIVSLLFVAYAFAAPGGTVGGLYRLSQDGAGRLIFTPASTPTPTPTVTVTVPGPTVTVTAPPTPTPTPTQSPSGTPTWPPTASPSVTPTPTPLPTPTPGWTVISGQTFTTYTVPFGTQNTVYENCTFTGGLPNYGDYGGVLSITQPAHDIIFRDCVIETGPAGANGVKIVDKGGTVYNITFERVTFKSQPRMGFECISRPSDPSKGYRSINLINCTFEVQGSQMVSYDGTYASGSSLVTGNLLKGGGMAYNTGGMGSGFEINGPTNMTVTNNRIYACANGLLNLQMGQDDGYSGDSGWVVSDNIIDASVTYGPVGVGSAVVGGINVRGGVFARNVVRSGLKSGGCIALTGCRDMDWRTTTFTDALGRSGYTEPWLGGGSSGNLF